MTFVFNTGHEPPGLLGYLLFLYETPKRHYKTSRLAALGITLVDIIFLEKKSGGKPEKENRRMLQQQIIVKSVFLEGETSCLGIHILLTA